ncbi:MAG TPA: xanthine dehydrogenase, partial [Thermoanaerobaculia bacterium]|nr:xanthine dehydrogenase [Thermoanaerobaculia bacterium]
MPVVGKNVPHDSAVGHVTGESVYVDDIALVHNELVVDFLWSPLAHARIRSLDVETARAIPGIVGLFTYRDLQHNLFGPVSRDEILLAEDECLFRGQPIVVIAADHPRTIAEAKKAIKVDLVALEPILTIS